jgi:hypothetical protein
MVFGKFDGTVGSPSPDGPDTHQYSITKVGTGEYTVVFDEPFEQDVHPISILAGLTTVESIEITAVASDRFTFKLYDNTDTEIDSEVWFTVAGSDFPDKF